MPEQIIKQNAGIQKPFYIEISCLHLKGMLMQI